MNFFDQLTNQEVSLNQTEERIINYLLQHYQNLQSLKIAKAAEDLYLSPNTIIRLCKKLGFSGFSELKYQILNDQKKEGLSISSEYSSVIDIMKKTIAINNPDAIQKAADLMFESRQIVFFSLGLSRIVALDIAKKLEHLNKIVIVPDDRDNCILYANNLVPGQVAFFISYSGSTDIIQKLSYIAQTKDIPIISLTGISQSFLSLHSTVQLYAYFRKLHYQDADVTSRLGFYMVTELIFDEYLKRFQSTQ